ncbi:MAG: phosphoheptose isomerase, partial [cyanobacterium endosymbiont of Rhopalodia fuxianensis]
QEIHVMTYHRICEQVEAQLFANAGLEEQIAV